MRMANVRLSHKSITLGCTPRGIPLRHSRFAGVPSIGSRARYLPPRFRQSGIFSLRRQGEQKRLNLKWLATPSVSAVPVINASVIFLGDKIWLLVKCCDTLFMNIQYDLGTVVYRIMGIVRDCDFSLKNIYHRFLRTSKSFDSLE
jgi:hypothetical protein